MRKIDIAKEIVHMQMQCYKEGTFYRVATLEDLLKCSMNDLKYIHNITKQVLLSNNFSIVKISK